MPLKCRGCKHYCLTKYKSEYHGMVEGCEAGISKEIYPHCYEKKEQDDGMEV